MKILPLVIVAAAFAFSVPDAHSNGSFGQARFQTVSMSLDQAISMVQSRYGAKVVRANTVEEEGRVVHYIRLISADRSRVWTVRVDAATGREF